MALLTIKEISSRVGITRQALTTKKFLNNYLIESRSSGGRPAKLYSSEILNEFRISEQERIEKLFNPEPKRSDRGTPRKITAEMEEEFRRAALAEYLAQSARNDIQGACWRAAKTLWDEIYANLFGDFNEMAEYYYKRRCIRNDKYFRGWAYADEPPWKRAWEHRWKRHDTQLITAPTMRYNLLEMGESCGLLGKGIGAATVFWLDDHVGDSFIKDEESEKYYGSLPKGLYLIDGWTGMPLDFEPGEVTATTTGLIVIRTALRYGLPYIVGLENSRAMKSVRVEQAIESLYPDELLKTYRNGTAPQWFSTMFTGFHSPIVRNVPNIPRFPFKARLEAWFKNCKIHDALYFGRTYQGGGKDAVQMRSNTMPVAPGKDYTIDNYFSSLNLFFKTEFLEKLHPGMFPNFTNKTNLLPTIKNVWNWYGGDGRPGTGIMPDMAKIANVLYWLSETEESKLLHKTVVKAVTGRVTCVIDGIQCWFVDSTLNNLKGEKIAIITLPDNISVALGRNVVRRRNCNYAALFHIQHGKPVFLNFCKNAYTDDGSDIAEHREIVQTARKELFAASRGVVKEREEELRQIEDRKKERLEELTIHNSQFAIEEAGSRETEAGSEGMEDREEEEAGGSDGFKPMLLTEETGSSELNGFLKRKLESLLNE